MDLRILLKEVELKKTDNYFVMLQYEEVLFPSKRVRVEKFRTNICADTSSPRFGKNIFLFQNVQLSNRMTLKLACFSAAKIDENMAVEELIVVSSKQREIFQSLRRQPPHLHAEDDHLAQRPRRPRLRPPAA